MLYHILDPVDPMPGESVDLKAMHKRPQKLAKVVDRFPGARASSPARDSLSRYREGRSRYVDKVPIH